MRNPGLETLIMLKSLKLRGKCNCPEPIRIVVGTKNNSI